MIPGASIKPLHDPDYLTSEAQALLALAGTHTALLQMGCAEDIYRAQQTVGRDLLHADLARQQHGDAPVAETFRADHKLAALLYLTKHKLLDIAYGPAHTLDVVTTRREIGLITEILHHLHAVAGMGVLYEFALSQQVLTQDEIWAFVAHVPGASKESGITALRDPHFWHKVCQHYLLLLARMTEARPAVLAFLKNCPPARRLIEQLMTAPEAGVVALARALGEDYVKARQAGEIAEPETPIYLRLYQQYAPDPPDSRLIGLASRLSAEEQLRQAINAHEFPIIVKWMVDGSPGVISAAFAIMRAELHAASCVTMLGEIIRFLEMPLVPLTATLLELSAINRTIAPQGGEASINALLVEAAITDDETQTGAARVAVRELRAASAFNDILVVIERAPLLAAAEEGLRAMRDLRRLPLAETVVSRRPALIPALQQEQQYLLEVRSLLESAWGCQTAEMARVYLERLKALHAIPELEQLGSKHKHLSELANKTLAALRLESTRAPRA